MSGTGEVRADFAGEERTFRIQLGEIRRIEDACKIGVGEVVSRLARANLLIPAGLQGIAQGLTFHAADVREVIYQGLIGGGMPAGEATALVRREIDLRGWQGLKDHVSTALMVLWGAREAPTSGEPQAGEPATRKSRSTSSRSTASARSSGSPRARSTD